MVEELFQRPNQPSKVLKRPFIALSRLIIFAKDYWRGDYDSDQLHIPASLKPPKKHASIAEKESWNEHEEAIRIARAILEYNDIRQIESVRRARDDANVVIGWHIPGDEEIGWSDAGSDYILIPQFPRI